MAAADDDDANASVPSGPVPFKDIGDGTFPEHTPMDTEELDDLVAALPRRQNAVLELRLYQGCWLPKYWVPGVVEFQRRFTPRPDDVVLASFPKCGTTWLMSLAFATLARRAHPPAAGAAGHPLRRLHPHDCVPFIDELFARGAAARLDALLSPRLMSTHLPHALLPPPVAAGGCRVVYICRDPKDMAVSLWHFTRRSSRPAGLSFAEVFGAVCDGTVALGPVWEHALSYWRAAAARPDRVLFLRYEELLRDPGGGVRRLAEFMGRPFSAAEEAAGDVAAVVELCSLDGMKGREASRGGTQTAGNYLAIPHDSFFRKGVVGDWASLMTPEMAARMDEIFREKLQGTGFSFA